MKELLDQLETKVSALLDERDTLRREIKSLKQRLSDADGSLREEITSLRGELSREQTARETAVKRIDALLSRVRERITE